MPSSDPSLNAALARTLFAGAGDALLLVDDSGGVLAANPSAIRLFDRSPDGIAPGTPFWALYPEPAAGRLSNAWKASVERLDLVAGDGTVDARHHALRIERDLAPGRHLVRIRDRMPLVNASRSALRSLAELAAGTAHAFNNTLTVVQNLAALLRDELPDGPEREDVEAILESAAEAGETTRALSAFGAACGLRGNPETTPSADLDDLLANGLGVLRRLLPKRTPIETDLDCASFPVNGEPVLQALVLWLQHVRGTLPEGGRIRVCSRTERSAADDPTALLTLEAGGATPPDGETLDVLRAVLATESGTVETSAAATLRLRLPPTAPRG